MSVLVFNVYTIVYTIVVDSEKGLSLRKIKGNIPLLTNPNDINKTYYTVHKVWLPNLHYIPYLNNTCLCLGPQYC